MPYTATPACFEASYARLNAYTGRKMLGEGVVNYSRVCDYQVSFNNNVSPSYLLNSNENINPVFLLLLKVELSIGLRW